MGTCQRKLARSGQGGFVASNYDQTLHMQVVKDELADHPPSSNDVCPFPAITEERVGFFLERGITISDAD